MHKKMMPFAKKWPGIGGWPEKRRIKGPVKRCYPVSFEILIIDGLLMWNKRPIFPSALQKLVLEKIQTGHQGHERARQGVWWPGLSSEIKDFVGKCSTCWMNQEQMTELRISSTFPELQQ